MVEIDVCAVSPALRALFNADSLPASLRCFAVLDGQTTGRILADHPTRPTWSVVQEAAFGTIYPGGLWDGQRLCQIVTDLRQGGDVLLGLWPGDSRSADIPPAPEYEGTVLEFTNRPMLASLDALLRQVPAGCTIRRVNRALFERSIDHDWQVMVYGSVEKALERGQGFYLMRGDDILCEAFAGPPNMGTVEIGVNTREPHRGRGYATFTCAHLVQTCEEQGYQTYWNCASQNLASAAIARKLGYRREQMYRLWAWFQTS